MEGVVGNPAIFQWTVERGNDNIVSLTTYVGTSFNAAKLLFPWGINIPGGPSPLVSTQFKDRLSASVIGNATVDQSVIYQLKLDNVQLSDKNQSFYLHAAFSLGSPTGEGITLIRVEGIHYFLSFFIIFLSYKT